MLHGQVSLVLNIIFVADHGVRGFSTRLPEFNQCPSPWGLTEDRFCLFSDSGVVFMDELCYLPKAETSQIKKQSVNIEDCAQGILRTHPDRKCAPVDLTPDRKASQLCVSGESVYGVSKLGGLTCEVKRPNIVFNKDDLPKCDQETRQTPASPEKMCSTKLTNELRTSTAKPNLKFCTTKDGKETVKVTQGQTSCVVSKDDLPESVKVSTKCSAKKGTTEAFLSKKDDEAAFLSGLIDCQLPNKKTISKMTLKGQGVICKIRDEYLFYYTTSRRVCRLPREFRPKIKLASYKECNSSILDRAESAELDVYLTRIPVCEERNSVNLKTVEICSYRRELLVFRSSMDVCRLIGPNLHENMLQYHQCGPQKVKQVVETYGDTSIQQPPVRKRTAECSAKISGPKQPPSKMVRTIAPRITNWVASSSSHTFRIGLQNISILDSNGIRQVLHRPVVPRSLLQTNVQIQTDFTVVVFSQDVEDADFPGNLARALKTNIDAFDESGNYTVDPQSIEVKEGTIESDAKTTRNLDNAYVSKIFLGITVTAEVAIIILLMVHIRNRHRWTGRPMDDMLNHV